MDPQSPILWIVPHGVGTLCHDSPTCVTWFGEESSLPVVLYHAVVSWCFLRTVLSSQESELLSILSVRRTTGVEAEGISGFCVATSAFSPSFLNNLPSPPTGVSPCATRSSHPTLSTAVLLACNRCHLPNPRTLTLHIPRTRHTLRILRTHLIHHIHHTRRIPLIRHILLIRHALLTPLRRQHPVHPQRLVHLQHPQRLQHASHPPRPLHHPSANIMPYYAAGYTITFFQVFDLVYHLTGKSYKRDEYSLALDFLYDDLLNKYGCDMHDLEDTVEPTILIVCLESSDAPISTKDLLNNKTATNIRSYLDRAGLKPYKSHSATWKNYPG
ncbi:hypothetical protein P691DRAFT_788396 [Macrolepiota fuliginosa MF-IS2]|uniref:Uncharacterized protein n=1 Tax=Macrolepiota fuliginosa MF-IS2 TaxID=1400762 RepID=A0A9P5X358_9AGAR|nr:hypothetical protein P691DRAFT_788396 [Macrolepiota fuliginosa MF-IS2]